LYGLRSGTEMCQKFNFFKKKSFIPKKRQFFQIKNIFDFKKNFCIITVMDLNFFCFVQQKRRCCRVQPSWKGKRRRLSKKLFASVIFVLNCAIGSITVQIIYRIGKDIHTKPSISHHEFGHDRENHQPCRILDVLD
jgi:hypothetical protein